MQFPTQNAQWTDLSLVYADTIEQPELHPRSQAVLYAALGTTPATRTTWFPAVMSSAPASPSTASRSTTPSSGARAGDDRADVVRRRPAAHLKALPPSTSRLIRGPRGSRGQFAQPVNTTVPPGYLPEVPLNGHIKVSAFTLPRILDEPEHR